MGGLFQRYRRAEAAPPIIDDTATIADGYSTFLADSTLALVQEPTLRAQVMAMTTFLIVIASLRLMSRGRLKALMGEHVLDLSALNDATMYKEVFLAYLNAALLEPVLAIGGMEHVQGQELVINIFTLGSICWWIWMVTDAFDYTDVCQMFKYQ